MFYRFAHKFKGEFIENPKIVSELGNILICETFCASYASYSQKRKY